MTIYTEMSLEDFEAWSGAVDTLNRIINEGKCEVLENILEDLYPEGMTDTELNDLLWFEEETVYEWLGIRSEEKIREELEEVKAELDELMEEFEDLLAEEIDEINGNREIAGMNELDEEEIVKLQKKLWNTEDFAERSEELNDKIFELEEELENI